VFVTGLSEGVGSLYDFATVSYDAATGTQLWVARYDSASHGDESATSIDVSPDGTQVYVTGCASPQQYCVGGDYLTVAYRTADGTKVWTSRYSATAQSQDTPTKVVAGPDGSAVYVTGVSDGFGTDDDFVTLAYDAKNGSQLWLARYNGPTNGGDQPADVSVSPDGTRIFVTGCTGDQYCTGHYATVGYDAATGGEVWSAADLRGYHPGSVAISPDGTRVFVTGYGYGDGVGTWDYVTVAHDAATGENLWTSTYDGGVHLHDFGRVVTVDPDGDRIYVTGESDSPNTFMGWATLAYDPTTGEELWLARFGKGSAPFAMQMSANGSRLFITGYMEGGRTLYDFATLSYSA
jgi:DNA-binding beta-propeller fold protein YncE